MKKLLVEKLRKILGKIEENFRETIRERVLFQIEKILQKN